MTQVDEGKVEVWSGRLRACWMVSAMATVVAVHVLPTAWMRDVAAVLGLLLCTFVECVRTTFEVRVDAMRKEPEVSEVSE